MKFSVMSRKEAKRTSFNQDIEDCIIISITDVDASENHFSKNAHIKGILRLSFDDVDFGRNCITKEDGRRILGFVREYLYSVDRIIVHCEAGISRSAGVCAALMKIINGSDMEIFNNPRFCPNMSCYRTVLETYYEECSEREYFEME